MSHYPYGYPGYNPSVAGGLPYPPASPAPSPASTRTAFNELEEFLNVLPDPERKAILEHPDFGKALSDYQLKFLFWLLLQPTGAEYIQSSQFRREGAERLKLKALAVHDAIRANQEDEMTTLKKENEAMKKALAELQSAKQEAKRGAK